MVGVEGVSKVWLRGTWLQLEFDTHRFELYISMLDFEICFADLQHWPGVSWCQVQSGFGEELR